MQGSAAMLVRQVMAQQGAAAAAAPACVMRVARIMSSAQLQHCSCSSSSGGARAFAAKADPVSDQEEQHASTSSSSSSSSSQRATADAAAGGGAAAGASSSSEGTDSAGSTSSSGGGFGDFSRHFDSFKSRLGGGAGDSGADGSSSSSSEPLAARAARLAATIRKEVADAVLPRAEAVSVTRAYEGPRYTAPAGAAYDGPTALAAVQQPETPYSRLMKQLGDKFGSHPLFSKFAGASLADNPLSKKASELADDLREKYETSDHPAVHKVEDVKEKLFGQSETAAAMAVIRARDPRFDMSTLLAGVRHDAPLVVKAFMERDEATLARHIGPELQERMAGMFRHFEAMDQIEDPTILFVGEPELVELKLLDGSEPLVVVQFACQQIKCTRDRFGNVVDGHPSAIQRVYYFWGLQQEEQGVVLPSGKVLPPRWVVKDMMWQGHLALV